LQNFIPHLVNTAKIINEGEIEPLIIMAISESTIDLNAISVTTGDKIVYALESEIMPFYDLDLESYIEGFKGAILYREDKLMDIKAPYDWKNWKYENNVSPIGNNCKGIEIKNSTKNIHELDLRVPFIIIGDNCYNLSFGFNCININLGNDCHDNKFGNNCYLLFLPDKACLNEFKDNSACKDFTESTKTASAQIVIHQLNNNGNIVQRTLSGDGSQCVEVFSDDLIGSLYLEP
jgi:hypothetical protein